MTGLFDSFQRRIDYLRISVTDRCNLRCFYCSVESVPHLPRREILSYEEIQRVVQAAAGLGIKSIRLTGGEPLIRPNLSQLVKMLSQIEGIDDISLTSNGTLLGKYAVELKEKGLKRVNVSLDTLKADKFRYITGSNQLEEVLDGIEAARQAGLNPVKINMVVLKGINDNELLDLARMSLDGWHVRFIEFMPLAMPKAQAYHLVAVPDMMGLISSLGELEPCKPVLGKGPARYYRLPGAKGTIGFIRPLSDCFCSDCNRFRITADGRLRPCLLADDEVDLKGPLRHGAGVDELKQLMQKAVANKPERHNLNQGHLLGKRQMRQIGG